MVVNSKRCSFLISLLFLVNLVLGQATNELILDDLKIIQASAYRCLYESKPDSAIYFANQLIELADSRKASEYVKGQQFNYSAYIYQQVGNPTKSFILSDSASIIFNKIDSLNADLAASLWRKGSSLLRLGDYFRAKNNLEQALDIATPINYYPSNIQIDLADTYHLMGDLKNSQSLYEELLKEPESLSLLLSLIVNANLSDIYLNSGLLEKAYTSFEPVDDIVKQGFLDDSPQIADLLKIKANLLRSKGEDAAALETVKSALEFHERNSPQNKRERSKLLCLQSDLALIIGDLDLAKVSCQQAKEIFDQSKDEKIEDPYHMVVNHLDAKISFAKYKQDKDPDQLKESLESCKRAQYISDQIRLNMLFEQSKLNLAGYLTDNTAIALDALYELYSESKEPGLLEDIFYFIEKSKNQTLLDEMLERLWSQDNALSRIEAIKALEFEIAANSDSTLLSKQVITLDQLKQDLRLEFADKYAELAGQTSLQAIRTIGNEQQMTTVFFGQSEDYSYALCLQNESSSFVRLDKGNAELSALIKDFQNLVYETNTPSTAFGELAFELYQSLFGKLSIDHQRLCIIPNELLSTLPFAALVTDHSQSNSFKQLTYFSDRYDIQYALSSYFLVDKANRNNRGGNILAIVDETSEHGNLTSHKKMLDAVLQNQDGELYQGISIDKLKQEFNESPLVHISSHGFFDQTDAQESYILMPGDPDFKYKIKDIYQSSFASNPFVVLNSCETGRGHQLEGEGTNNFTRALSYAGALGTIESAWKINAFSTAEIFKGFYGFIEQGMGSSRALSDAMRAYRLDENIDEALAHPYYWAGFKHYGQPYKNQQSGMLWYLVLGGLALIALFFLFRKRS